MVIRLIVICSGLCVLTVFTHCLQLGNLLIPSAHFPGLPDKGILDRMELREQVRRDDIADRSGLNLIFLDPSMQTRKAVLKVEYLIDGKGVSNLLKVALGFRGFPGKEGLSEEVNTLILNKTAVKKCIFELFKSYWFNRSWSDNHLRYLDGKWQSGSTSP